MTNITQSTVFTVVSKMALPYFFMLKFRDYNLPLPPPPLNLQIQTYKHLQFEYMCKTYQESLTHEKKVFMEVLSEKVSLSRNLKRQRDQLLESTKRGVL